MERDERRRADALDSYWDAVLGGEAPTKPSNVEDEAAAVIANFGGPFVSPHYGREQERVRARIFSRARELEDAMHLQTLSLPLPMNENGVKILPASSWSVERSGLGQATHQRWSAQVATALLLLLTIGLGYLTFRPGSSTPGRLTNMPAVVVASTPTAEAALSTVFATTLPAEMVPTAGNLDFITWRAEMNPGTRASYLGQFQGIQIIHVLEGDLSLHMEGALQVFRDASIATSAAQVSPGAEVVLHPGDTAVYAFGQSVEYANPGATPVQIVSGGIFAGHSAWLPDEFILKDFNEEYSVPALPSGPVDVTLTLAVLTPNGGVPAPSAGALVLEVGATGDADIAQGADGSLRNIGPRESTIYALTLAPVEPGSDPPSS